jgi:LysW-gamma-L-lysine carboxypeptidase
VTRDAAIELLRGLVAIPSLSRREARAASWLVDAMSRAGFERAFVDEAGNAVGEIGPHPAPRTIVLLGHIDTVPGDIPVRIEATPQGDALYGRGSVDAKGPLATFVAATARLGAAWAREAGVRVVVVGAVEEEAASSKGARQVLRRFDGTREPVPDACIIGEPSQWHRITLGYKGRLLLELAARQPMAHTAGRHASVATAVVELWNRVQAHADRVNADRSRVFDQLTPSLRAFNTSTDAAMQDHAAAQFAWRLPVEFDVEPFLREVVDAAAAQIEGTAPAIEGPAPVAGARLERRHEIEGPVTAMSLRFHDWEPPWLADRQNALVRSFLGAIRASGREARPGFVVKTGTSDMNVVAPVWRCPVVAYGPGDSSLDHTPHEHVHLDEYWRAVQVVERAVRAWGAEVVRA